jgi:hypothetical protein
MRMVLELMKRVRMKQDHRKLLEFFGWLAQLLLEHPQPARLVQSMLTYAWTIDSTLDVEAVVHTVESNPELKQTVMTIAEQLIAQGKAEGEARGTWIGRLQTLEEVMGLPATDSAALAALEACEIEKRFRELQRDYNAQFKPQG